jgi:hypothetical protein
MSEEKIIAALQELTGREDLVQFLEEEKGISTVSWGC